MISAIVAVDKDWGIGYNGDLLEHIPEDLKYFKELTSGNIVVMGRKTWNSLPKKPLKDRLNLIITSMPGAYEFDNNGKCLFWFVSKEKAIDIMLNDVIMDYFIIGGGQIYEQLLPYCDQVYVTKILKDHKNVDTYFPNLDKSPEWEIDTCTELRYSNDIPYAFLTYKRV